VAAAARTPRHWIKLGFGALDPAKIADGVAIIAEETRKLLG
jgi:GntR family transcriptional regulator/MocR family aminotransferase